jgi:quercetin dioxygenase-like cupin family protein
LRPHCGFDNLRIWFVRKGPAIGYSVIHIDEIETGGPGGAVRFVRRSLGVKAFGINRFDLQPGSRGHEHDETGSGQEEVAIVVAGGGHWEADGAMIPVREGSVIRFDAETTRCPVAGPDGLAFIAVGSAPGSCEPHGPF